MMVKSGFAAVRNVQSRTKAMIFRYSNQFWPDVLINSTVAQHYHQIAINNKESTGRMEEENDIFGRTYATVVEQLNIALNIPGHLVKDSINNGNFNESESAFFHSDEQSAKRFQHALSIALYYHDHVFSQLEVNASASSSVTALERLERHNKCRKNVKETFYADHSITNKQMSCAGEAAEIPFHISHREMQLLALIQHWIYLAAYTISRECFVSHQPVLKTALLGPSDLFQCILQNKYKPLHLRILQLLMRGGKSYLELLVHYNVRPRSKEEWAHLMRTLNMGNGRVMHEIVDVNANTESITKNGNVVSRSGNATQEVSNKVGRFTLLHIPLLDNRSVMDGKSEEEHRRITINNYHFTRTSNSKDASMHICLRRYQHQLRALCGWRELFALIKWRVEFASCKASQIHITSTAIQYVLTRYLQECEEEEYYYESSSEEQERECNTECYHKRLAENKITQVETFKKLEENDGQLMTYYLNSNNITRHTLEAMLARAKVREAKWLILARACGIDKNNRLKSFTETSNNNGHNTEDTISNTNNCVKAEDKQSEKLVSLQEVDNVTLSGEWCVALRGLLDYVMNYLERTPVTHKHELYTLRRRYYKLRNALDRCILLQKEVRRNFSGDINSNENNAINRRCINARTFASSANEMWMETFEWIDFALSPYSRKNKIRTKLLTHQWAALKHVKCDNYNNGHKKRRVEQREQFTMLNEEEARAAMTCAERKLIIQPPIAALDVLSQNGKDKLTLPRESKVNLVHSLAEEEKNNGRSAMMPASFVIDLRRRLLLLKAVMKKNKHTPLSLVEFEGTRHHKTRKRLLPFITHQLRVELLPRIVMMVLASTMELALVHERNHNCECSNAENCSVGSSKTEGAELLLKCFEEWIVKDVHRLYKSYSSLHEYLSQMLIYNSQTVIAALLEEYVHVQFGEPKNGEAELHKSNREKQEWQEHENSKVIFEELQKQERKLIEYKKEKEIKMERIAHILRAILVKVVHIVLQPQLDTSTFVANNNNNNNNNNNKITSRVNGETSNGTDASQSSENNIISNKYKNGKEEEQFWSIFDETNVSKNALEKNDATKFKDSSSSNSMLTVNTKNIPHSMHALLSDAAMTFDNYLHSLRAETVAQVGDLEQLISVLTAVQPSNFNECDKKEANYIDAIRVLAPESMQVVLKALLLHFLHLISNNANDEIEHGTDVKCNCDSLENGKGNKRVHHLCVHDTIRDWFRHHSSLRTLFCAIPVRDVCNVQECDAQLRMYLQGMYYPEYSQILQDKKNVVFNEEGDMSTLQTADKIKEENEYNVEYRRGNENCIDLLAGRCYRYVSSSPMSALCKKENSMLKEIFAMLEKESEMQHSHTRSYSKYPSKTNKKTELSSVLPFSAKLNVAFACVNVERALEHFVCKLNKINGVHTSKSQCACTDAKSFPVEEPMILAGGSNNICNSLPFQLLALCKPTQVNCTLHATLPSLVEYMLASSSSSLRRQQEIFKWSRPREERTLNAHTTQKYSSDTTTPCFASPHSSCLPILHEHGLLNRLDVGTSGIVLVSTSWAQLLLARRAALQYKSIRKTYRAIVMSSTAAENSDNNVKDYSNSSSSNHTFYLPVNGVIYDSVVVQTVTGSAFESTTRTKTTKSETMQNDHEVSSEEYNSTKPERRIQHDETNTVESVETNQVINRSEGELGITRNVFDHNNESDWAVQHMSFTRFRVLRYNPVNCVYELEVQLRSGKRHQIRQHFCNIGFPLVGDSRYNLRWRRILSSCSHSEPKACTHNTLEQRQQCNELTEVERRQTDKEQLEERIAEEKEETTTMNMNTIMMMMTMADRLALHASSVVIQQLPMSHTSFLSTSAKSKCIDNDVKHTTTAVVTCPLPEDYTRLLRALFAESSEVRRK